MNVEGFMLKMMNFIGAAPAGSGLRDDINNMLHWLVDNEVCLYSKTLPPGGQVVKVLWRCSVDLPDWRAPVADSIDYSTMVLGYAINFLPEGFYATHAA